MLKSVGRRENLENYETYLAVPERAVKEKKLTAKHFILIDELGHTKNKKTPKSQLSAFGPSNNCKQNRK